ncbi:MAG: AhpC/TSA family protein [Bacteroidaceae bacterium]|nr:AhpC/TSA family protein [Bacteroidaceae bacterium]
MKPTKLLFAITMAFTTVCGFAQDAESTKLDYYEIKGILKNVPDGTVLQLFAFEGERGFFVGTTKVDGGEFCFKSAPRGDGADMLMIAGFMNEGFSLLGTHLWASAGDCILVEGEDKLLFTWKVTGGAPENAVWATYRQKSYKEWKRYEQILLEKKALKSQLGSNEDAVAKFIQLEKESDMLQQRICANDFKIMKHTAVDDIWMDRFCHSSLVASQYKDKSCIKELKCLYNKLTDEQRKHPQAQKAYENLYPKQTELVKAFDGELTDLDGNKHSLAELKGKYILLDFWASGCGPCITALPELALVSEMYKDRLCVVSVNIEPVDNWREALKKHPIAWYNWNDGKDGTGIYDLYNANGGGIPLFVLISPDGYIIDKWYGYGDGAITNQLKGKIE